MTTYNYPFVLICSAIILAAIMIPTVIATPLAGAASFIGSNNVTIPLGGCAAGDVWVIWGHNPGGEVWNTANETTTGGAVSVTIWGAPMMGNTLYYARGCDSTGCGNEISFTTAAITPLPTTTFGAGYKNLSARHFDIQYVPAIIESVYSPKLGDMGLPRSMLYGILISLVFMGLWLRTRSIRICSSLGIMLGGLLFSDSVGLHLGVPGPIQLLGGLMIAAGLAGWVLALWLKK
jgi:hypothetical protein